MRKVLFIVLLVLASCSSKNKERSDFQIMIVEAPLECTEEPRELKAECRCPEHDKEGIATIISSVGSVIGNLISTIWD